MRIKKVLLVMSIDASAAEIKKLQESAKTLRWCGVEAVELVVTDTTEAPKDIATFDRVQIYGNTITPEVLAIAQAAVRAGVEVLRKAYKWRVEPICRRCADFHKIAGAGPNTDVICEHFMRTKEMRLCPPIGKWCAYFEKRGDKHVNSDNHTGTGGSGAES